MKATLRTLCIVTVVLSSIHNSIQLPRRISLSRRAIDGSRGRKYFNPEEEDDSYGSSGGEYDPFRDVSDFSDIRKNVPGEPGIDYPAYTTLPQTGFTCGGRYRGYYADESTGCQVFHVCQDDILLSSFLCPVGSTFSQKLLTCDWWNKVDCSSTRNYAELDNNGYNYEDDDQLIRKAYIMMNLRTGTNTDVLIDPDQRAIFIGNDLPEDYLINTNYDDYDVQEKYKNPPSKIKKDEIQTSYAPTVPTVTTTTRKLYSPTVPTNYKSSTLAYDKLDQVTEGYSHLNSNNDKQNDNNYQDYYEKEVGFNDRSDTIDDIYTDEMIEMRESIGLARALNDPNTGVRYKNKENDQPTTPTTTEDYEDEKDTTTFGRRTTALLKDYYFYNNETRTTTVPSVPTKSKDSILLPSLLIDYSDFTKDEDEIEDTTLTSLSDYQVTNYLNNFINNTRSSFVNTNRPEIVRLTLEQVDEIIEKSTKNNTTFDDVNPIMINQEIHSNDDKSLDTFDTVMMEKLLSELDRVPRPFSRSVEFDTKSDYGLNDLNKTVVETFDNSTEELLEKDKLLETLTKNFAQSFEKVEDQGIVFELPKIDKSGEFLIDEKLDNQTKKDDPISSTAKIGSTVQTEFLPSIGFSLDTDEGRRKYVQAVFDGIIDQTILTGNNYFPNSSEIKSINETTIEKS